MTKKTLPKIPLLLLLFQLFSSALPQEVEFPMTVRERGRARITYQGHSRGQVGQVLHSVS